MHLKDIKFEINKKNLHVSLLINEKGKATRKKEVTFQKNVFIKGNTPSKENILKFIAGEIQLGAFTSKEDFLSIYHNNKKDIIDKEMKNLIKCYMKIIHALECIDISDEIYFDSQN